MREMPIQAEGVGIPERFEIANDGSVFRIQWRWPRIAALLIAVFAAGWDAFLVSWYSTALTLGERSSGMALFALPHTVVGLVLPYVALAFLFNSTRVEVGEGQLRVRHRPIPFPGNKTLAANDVRQLFSVERIGRKGSVTYDVMARLASERETKLVSGLTDERQARFIEQRIESRLGLADRPVIGELPR
jgi:hypothetical protein